jgi:hypothetical protein
MIQGNTDNIPFLGQMIKVILRNGNSYDVNISEKYYEVNNIFTLMYRQHNNIMNEATTMNLPFIGQIVKLNVSNGDQYDAKFTQAYNSFDTNDTSSFYIMLKKNSDSNSNSNSDSNSHNPRQIKTYLAPTRQAPPPPPSREQSIILIHDHNIQVTDCTKSGTSINIDNLTTKPLPYRIN